MDKQIVKVNPSYDAEFGRGRKLTIKAGRVDSIPVDPRDHIGSAAEMPANIDIQTATGPVNYKAMYYWSNRLCDALERADIDADLIARCIEAIRESS